MGRSGFLYSFEYAIIRTLCALVNAVPYPLAMSLARGFGWLACNVLRFKRCRTDSRIRAVFPNLSSREVAAIASKSLQNILQTGVEMMRAPRLDRAWMDRYVKDGPLYRDRLQALVDEGKGVVITVPHSGNWYMAAWAMAKYSLPLVAIAARQRNPKLDAWMNRQYGDIEVLDRDCKNTLAQIHSRLLQGRAFAILPDLRVRHPDVAVEFFGGEANVSRSAASLAVHADCPIVVAVMTRKDGRHVFSHLATLRPDSSAQDKKEEARRLTRQVLKLLSDEVMKSPGDWYWYNKRWILEPVSASARAKSSLGN